MSQAEVILLHARSRLSSIDHKVEHRFSEAEVEKSVQPTSPSEKQLLMEDYKELKQIMFLKKNQTRTF